MALLNISKSKTNKLIKSVSSSRLNNATEAKKAGTSKVLLLDAARKKLEQQAKSGGSKADLSFEKKYAEYKREWNEILTRKKKEFDDKWVNTPKRSACFEDFVRFRTLGHGSFGRVHLVKHKQTGKPYAMKVMTKREVVKYKQIEHTLNEKKLLATTSFPFIVSMAYSFKNNANLFIVLEFVSGGEMFSHLVRCNYFSEEQTKFYISQVVLAIEYLHSLDILHRDLKPENTLIASDGYIKITDFGFAKVVKTRAFTFCGTPEYLAPEIIMHRIYGKAVDWWAVGVLTYEMAAGVPPFSGEKVEMFEQITKGKYAPLRSRSDALKDFLKNMIQVDITKRYGNLKAGVDDIKKHKWFHNIDWMAIYKKNVIPPYMPKVKSPGDASNFEAHEEKELDKSDCVLFEAEFQQF